MAKEKSMIFADNFNRIIKEKGISISKLSKDLNIPLSTLYDNSTGKNFPRIKNVEKMSNYLGVSIKDLLDEYKEPDKGIYVEGIKTKESIIAIGQQLIERADDICNDLHDVGSITINAKIEAGVVTNFDVIKNYKARFKED